MLFKSIALVSLAVANGFPDPAIPDPAIPDLAIPDPAIIDQAIIDQAIANRRSVRREIKAKANKSDKSKGVTGELKVLTAFNNPNGYAPESIVFDTQNDMFISMSLHGEVIKVDPLDGSTKTLVRLPIGECLMPYSQAPYPLPEYNIGLSLPLPGLTFGEALDEDDNLYIAMNACNEGMPNPPNPNPNTGIWKVNTKTQVVTQVTRQVYPDRGDPMVCCPNSLEPGVYTYPEIWNGVEIHGDYVYMTNSYYGEISRAPKKGGPAELFFKDPRIYRSSDPSLDVSRAGLNGIKWYENSFIFSNTYAGEIWQLDLITKKGKVTPGELRLFCKYGHDIDEFDIDNKGRVWFTDFANHRVGVAYPDGSYDIVLTNATVTKEGGWLDRPTTLRFGRSKATQSTLFIGNSGFILLPPFFPGYPAVLTVEVDATGYIPPTFRKKGMAANFVDKRGYDLVEHLAHFDNPAGDPFGQTSRFPTSIVFDSMDNAYMAMNGQGEIWKRTPNGTLSTVVQGLPLSAYEDCLELGGSLGFPFALPNLSPSSLTVDLQNNLYASVNLCIEEDERNGVYKIDLAKGNFTKIAGIPRFPNKGITSSNPDIWNGVEYADGKLYMTNSFFGEVWCTPADGSGPATLWSNDTLIQDLERVLEGANGIVYHQGHMYVSNSGTGNIIKLGMPAGNGCGHAVSASVHAHIGVGCDEFAFAQDGTIFCASIRRANKGVYRWKVGDAVGTQILDRDDFFFDVTNSVAFGRIGDNKHQLYIVNSGIPFFSDDFVSSPSLVRVRVAEAGV